MRQTRRRFMRALAALSLERGYGAVTVEQVAARADLGRATFYTHFRDKDDLLSQVVAELWADLAERIDAGAPTDEVGFTGEPLETLFRHAGTEPELYRLVLRGAGDGGPLRDLLEGVAGTVERVWRARAEELRPRANVALDQAAWAWAGQTVALLLRWLETGMADPPERVARTARDIALRGHLWAQGFTPADLGDPPPADAGSPDHGEAPDDPTGGTSR